ncbi:hypothetical protein CROQUDRAFT_49925, partial [Cronartium quercuum f. sp. fusiforme G11]
IMIELIPRRGNSAKFFPHHGFLGISPVFVAGLIRVDLSPDDCRATASKLSVRLRCYEEAVLHHHVGSQHRKHTDSDRIIGHRGKRITVVWETTEVVWRASETDNRVNNTSNMVKLGRFEANWKLVVPQSVTDIGSMTYKSWKTWWQVEAVIQGPGPNPTVVKSYHLNLRNFRRPPLLGNLTILDGATRELPVLYSISTPSHVACGDTVNISIAVGLLPSIQGAQIKVKKATVSLQRKMSIRTRSESPKPSRLRSTSMWDLKTGITSCMDSESISIKSSSKSRRRPWTATRPTLYPNPNANESTSISIIQTTETEAFVHSPDDLLEKPARWTASVTMTIPKPRSNYHYSIGDSCITKLASVRYFFTFQLLVKTSLVSKKVINLASSEVEFTGVPLSERLAALAKIEGLTNKNAHLG